MEGGNRGKKIVRRNKKKKKLCLQVQPCLCFATVQREEGNDGASKKIYQDGEKEKSREPYLPAGAEREEKKSSGGLEKNEDLFPLDHQGGTPGREKCVSTVIRRGGSYRE